MGGSKNRRADDGLVYRGEVNTAREQWGGGGGGGGRQIKKGLFDNRKGERLRGPQCPPGGFESGGGFPWVQKKKKQIQRRQQGRGRGRGAKKGLLRRESEELDNHHDGQTHPNLYQIKFALFPATILSPRSDRRRAGTRRELNLKY
ncbi:hypothetical protein Zmor_025962 [Zophobas morio]|uniref:Uncharacterized protein n=1 Tax=Zophobas morio TaxID=2755281 RepID=A0AA38M4Q5_9CUCU|nr:hypothetical protein Zmor_025962 [Zophobas morio]